MDKENKGRLISIVIPCYNEADVFPLLRTEINSLIAKLEKEFKLEIIFIDDGSKDSTWQQITSFAIEDNRVRGISLSRNFGHQSALTCGYEMARGDAVISMDADLQDPPEALLQMIDLWRKGGDIVYGIRSSREGETAFKRWSAKLFYKLIHLLGSANIREDSGDFRLMSRKSLEAFLKMPEQHRFIRGMVGWLGFRTEEIHFQRQARAAGLSKYPFLKMLRFAIDAIVSFSFFPLRLSFVFGIALSAIFLVYMAKVLFAVYILGRVAVPGWTSLTLAIIAFGSFNLLCLGIIGEYVGRIYEQSKARPQYLISEVTDGSSEYQMPQSS